MSGTPGSEIDEVVFGVRAAFDQAPTPMCVFDLDGNVLAVNQEAEATLGYRHDEILGAPAARIVSPESLESFRARFSECASGHRVRNVEFGYLDRNGQPFPMITSFSPVVDDQGRQLAMLAVSKDISQLRRREHRRRQDQSKLAEDERMVSLGQIAAGLAHELNQPLTAITAYCDAALSLATEKSAEGELIALIQRASEQAHRAGTILKSLQDIVRRGQIEREPCNLNDIIRDSIRLLEAEIRRAGATVMLAPADELPAVMAERTQIQQVVINLVRNSLEAVEGRPERKVTITTQVEGGNVKATVRDTGGGFDSLADSRLFMAFETTKVNGLGIGLWVSRSIIEAHDGQLWKEDGVADGAAMSFTLPVHTG